MSKQFDLEERTAKFAESVLIFCKTLKQDAVTKPLISQLVRAATSIGANYMEANSASSKKDFNNKIHISKKETQETKHWLRMFVVVIPDKKPELRILWQEAQELTLIFGKILSTLRKKLNN